MDPTMRQDVIDATARLLAAEAKAELGGIDALIWIDVGFVAQWLGVSRKSAVTALPTKRINARTTSVRLADLKAYCDGLPAGE
jgi:hypothetical protein